MSLRKYSTEELIEFKGNKKGLIINIKKVAPFEQVKESIIDRLEENVGFFNGAKIYQINSDYLNDVQMMMIEDAITSRSRRANCSSPRRRRWGCPACAPR